MISIRKASYASAAALVLAVSPLVLAQPATAAPCSPGSLLPLKICPGSASPAPPTATPTAAPQLSRPPSQQSSQPPSGTAPPESPGQTPSRTPQIPPDGQPHVAATTGLRSSPPHAPGSTAVPSGGTPTGAVNAATGVASPSAAVPDPAASAPAGGRAAGHGPGPDEDGSLAGAFLLTLSGLLISASAAFGLRRTVRH